MTASGSGPLSSERFLKAFSSSEALKIAPYTGSSVGIRYNKCWISYTIAPVSAFTIEKERPP